MSWRTPNTYREAGAERGTATSSSTRPGTSSNITGHPAVSVPAGVLPGGLPFGLQLTAPRFRDDLLLDLAEQWEQARPWPWFAPGYDPLVPAP